MRLYNQYFTASIDRVLMLTLLMADICYAGVKDGRILNHAMNVSSYYDSIGFRASQARLDNPFIPATFWHNSGSCYYQS